MQLKKFLILSTLNKKLNQNPTLSRIMIMIMMKREPKHWKMRKTLLMRN